MPRVDEAVTVARGFIDSDVFSARPTPSANRAIRSGVRKEHRAPFTKYRLRHSFKTWLRHAGADLADIQDLYGHTDPTTTKIYLAPALAKQRDAIRGLCLATHE